MLAKIPFLCAVLLWVGGRADAQVRLPDTSYSRLHQGVRLAEDWQPESPDQQLFSDHPESGATRGHLETIRKKSRFLGWNYANAVRQEVEGDPTKSLSTWALPRARTRPSVLHLSSHAVRPNSGSANPGFSFRQGLPTGFIPTAVVAGDFNEDGKMDVAISNGGDNTIYVLLGNGDNTFKVPEILFTQDQAPVWITAVKLRTNGHLDLAVVDGDSKTLETFVGSGDGTFQAGVQVSLPQIPTYVLAADFNKDGNQDLVVGFVLDPGSTEAQFEVVLGDGAGGFNGTIVPPLVTNPNDYPVPTGWLSVGDINNDGYPDVVTTITGIDSLTYMSQAGASFAQGAFFAPSDGAMVVELADVNEDGCLDAVELGDYGYLTIAAGTCDGNFTQAPPVAEVGDLDPAVKVVDVDSDGHLDVVGSAAFYEAGGPGLGTSGGYLLSILKGDGKGNFSNAALYRGGTDEYSLAVADFNGDGKPEVLTIDSLENQASLFINDGTGYFDGPTGETIGYVQNVGAPNAPIPGAPMLSADLNGDRKPDLLLVEFGYNDPSQLTVMLNDGTGKFLPPLRSPITVGPSPPYPEYAVGAFRNPAKPDVVYLSKYEVTNVVAFFPGNGDGTFGAPTQLATLPWPLKVVVGDFNGDGKLDFVVVGTDLAQKNLEFDTFVGHGDGTFAELSSQLFPVENGGMPTQLFALDLNHDGKLDLLIGNNDNGGRTSNGDDLIEVLGNGDGTFQKPTTPIAHFGAVAVADLNGDGYPDLVQARDPSIDIMKNEFFSPSVTVYLGSANGTFRQQPSYDLPGITTATLNPALVGDFSGDGIVDIAVPYVNDLSQGTREESLRLVQGNGDGTFVVTGHTYQLQALSNPSVGLDFNGDGKTDLVELVGYTSSFHTIPAAPAPSLDLALDSSPVIGNNGSATVSLDKPAPMSEDVTLSASDPAIQLPSSIHFDTGQQTQDFKFTLGSGFDKTHIFALYATLGAETATAYGSKPNPNATVGVASVISNGLNYVTGEITIAPSSSLALMLQLVSESGYTGTFSSFQCAGLPVGASCNFSAASARVFSESGAGVDFQITTDSSTPFGSYTVQLSSTDGFIQSSTTLQLGIGDFAIAASPSMLAVGPSGSNYTTMTSTSTNGLNQDITLTCDDLPANASCVQAPGPFMANQGSATLVVEASQLAPKDYPFRIIGAINLDKHQVNEVLRVGDFKAVLSGNAATLSVGQTASFNVTMSSVNHFTGLMSVYCYPPDNRLSCVVSPAQSNLSEGGQAVFQLTIKALSTVGSLSLNTRRSYRLGCILLSLFLFSSLAIGQRKARHLSLLIIVVLTPVMWSSCGGGSGTGGSGGGGGGSGTQLAVRVTVLANPNPTDTANQKALGPIIITLN